MTIIASRLPVDEVVETVPESIRFFWESHHLLQTEFGTNAWVPKLKVRNSVAYLPGIWKRGIIDIGIILGIVQVIDACNGPPLFGTKLLCYSPWIFHMRQKLLSIAIPIQKTL